MFDIITIGTIVREVFIQAPAFKTVTNSGLIKKIGIDAPEAGCFALGSKLSIERPIFAGGGGAHNTAITFARQGFKTGIAGVLGDDVAGREILSSLKSENISAFIEIDKKLGTGYSVTLVFPDGERAIFTYRAGGSDIREKNITFPKMRADWAYISTGDIPISAMKEIVSKFKKSGTRVAINPSASYLKLKKADIEQLFGMVGVVILNRDEASILTGIPRRDEKKIFKEFDHIVDGIAVMTDGKNGVSASDGEYIYRAGIFQEKKVVDRTGAGDAFASGFIAGLIRKNDIGYALRVGSANATSVIEHFGATEGALTARDIEKPRWQELDSDIESV